jgi:DNA-binding NarL/FixJ family response regulator
MRVVIAEDHALLRAGIAAILEDHAIEVVASVPDADAALRAIGGHKPDLAIIDVRLPPAFMDEGVRLALEVRRRQPGLAVLVLSQYVEPTYSGELLATGQSGVGYLLKERVSDVPAFIDAVRRIADGGVVLDREVVATLFDARKRTEAETRLDTLTPRERATLELIAEGRTNIGIARELVITPGAVEKHVSSIFSKLNLPDGDADHRRVLAVLSYVRSAA